MSITSEIRNCRTCGSRLRGRSDKKFCNDYCRNQFNNEQKARNGYSPFIRQVGNILLRNRRVLAGLLPDEAETIRVHRDKLLRLGYHFRYGTHQYTTRSGKTYHYCYDYGYLPLDNDWILVVRGKEER